MHPAMSGPTGYAVTLVLAAVLSYAAVTALIYAFQRTLIYPTFAVSAEGAPPEGTTRVTLTTADGERLLGYWTPPRNGGPVLISFHGNASRPAYHARRFKGATWARDGWGFLTIAYRGYPGSTGSPTEVGLERDADAAYAFVAEHAPGARRVAHGHSIGAAVAIGLATRHPVEALFLEAAFTNLAAAADERFPWLATSLIRDRFPSDARAPGIRVPVTIVHGARDNVVPVAMGRSLASLFPHASLREVGYGDHITVFGALDHEVEPELLAGLRLKRPGTSVAPSPAGSTARSQGPRGIEASAAFAP